MTKTSPHCQYHPTGCPHGVVCWDIRENIDPFYPLYEEVEVPTLVTSLTFNGQASGTFRTADDPNPTHA